MSISVKEVVKTQKHTIGDLYQMQSLPLNDKIRMTQRRIEEWYEHYDGQVYVSFSGGKDSTVLLHIAREMYPDIKAVFADTGLEYPEIRQFVKTWDNVDWIKPKYTFRQTIEKYGYPFISKEVAECVWGARKYLTSLEQSGMLDRPTDRRNTNIDLKDYADSVSTQTQIGGGTRTSTENSEESVSIRMGKTYSDRQIWQAVQRASETQTGGGGTVRDFGNLIGIRAADGSINAKLWQGYRQYSGSTPDGNSSDEWQGDNGEYP